MLTNLFTSLMLNAGLSSLLETLKSDWIGPIFFIVVAGVSITFLLQRQIRAMLVFIIIAAVVGVLVFFADAFFGSNGSLTKFAKEQASTINMIMPQISMFLHTL